MEPSAKSNTHCSVDTDGQKSKIQNIETYPSEISFQIIISFFLFFSFFNELTLYEFSSGKNKFWC